MHIDYLKEILQLRISHRQRINRLNLMVVMVVSTKKKYFFFSLHTVTLITYIVLATA